MPRDFAETGLQLLDWRSYLNQFLEPPKISVMDAQVLQLLHGIQ